MTETTVTVTGLDVELGGVAVVQGIDLSVGRGEVVAVVGVNGAGKSTLLRCLAGLERPAAGELGVLDRPPADEPGFWRDVVLAADEPAWYPGLSVREHLELMHAVHPSPRLEVGAALDLFELRTRADAAPPTLSTGQRQRLSLAMALIRPSRLLLLDEPERGLDPAFRARLATILAGYAAGGGTVVMATHDLDLAGAAHARRVTLGGAA
ncbi:MULTISPECIES: ABC transporter ATP-binding protein [Thermomonosporaceae]|uniref:ABC transporter ATP-binding protein n=1 Tax=Thermomonosporaceae TaxID=2012 RepID=UPI00255AB054|nr:MULTISPECIES: ATP-binding cassette domain-containing protein [Thermomonosporaceae]MDL4777471.1 ATP-binding cassette domain-containing protein [Actinomadura xylanilytica]